MWFISAHLGNRDVTIKIILTSSSVLLLISQCTVYLAADLTLEIKTCFIFKKESRNCFLKIFKLFGGHKDV